MKADINGHKVGKSTALRSCSYSVNYGPKLFISSRYVNKGKRLRGESFIPYKEGDFVRKKAVLNVELVGVI